MDILLVMPCRLTFTLPWFTVHSALCRAVCKLNKYCHVTPFLHKLHCLPIHYRILFKYNLLTYKAIHFSQPPYLSSLIRQSGLTWGNRLSISSSKPNKTLRVAQLNSSCSHRVSWFQKTVENISFPISLSSTMAYLPYWMLIWKRTSFWNWTIPFWTSAL